ncbi:hypothetical protein [Alkalinema pantanalense]|uniref:hypothetical protein n=1 Tax=Alkalinema pantanalense TaxID=1620705 RepID=UPI003D6E280D
MLRIFLAVSVLAASLTFSAIAQAKPYGAECRFESDNQTINDDKCDVVFEGSLDEQYGTRTFVPQKATITWFDGVKTQITFQEITEFNNGVRSGTALIDGYSYEFVAFGSGGYGFKRYDPETGKTRSIQLSKWTGRYK